MQPEPHFDDIDKKIMKEALALAVESSKQKEVPVACLFVKFDNENKENYEIVARAHNLTNLTGDATKHCEILCIGQIDERLKEEKLSNSEIAKYYEDIVVYVTVEPCIMCGYALNIKNIKKAIYGCGNDKFGGNGSILSTHIMIPHTYETVGGLFPEEATEVLKSFYEAGNEHIPEEMRHRKKLKTEEEGDEQKDLIQNINSNKEDQSTNQNE